MTARGRTTYRPGQAIRFQDMNATVSDGMPTVRKGMVNGEQVGNFVPVFTERDNGRESATVLVHKSNILEGK